MNSVNKKNGIKVVFIEPMGAHSNVFARHMTVPMLGPLYLATIAEKAGYDVSILNENLLGRKIRQSELKDVDILCLSCMSVTVERGKKIAREYTSLRRSLGLTSRTVVGGIHASMIPDDVKNDFDQVFVGEAETKILDVLSGKIGEKVVHGEKLHDLDRVPIPNFKLLKNWEKMNSWSIMTSRGCPFNCTFCSVTEMFGHGYRTKSIDRIIEEVRQSDKKFVFFVDDHFVLNKNRTRKLLNSLKKNKLNIKWSCQLRAEVGKDPKLVARMNRAGCKTVFVGFESINPQSLLEMKKGQTVSDVKRSIKVFRENGINIHGMFMLGSDAEAKGIFKMTSDFCKKSGLSSVQYLIITPLPGTVFYKRMEKEGRLLHQNWQFYDGLHVVFQPKNFTPSELQQGMIDCFSEFYSYTRALTEAITIFFETLHVLIKRLYQSIHFPSLKPSVVKFFGRRIVKDWIIFNKSYLRYLKTLNLNKKNSIVKSI